MLVAKPIYGELINEYLKKYPEAIKIPKNTRFEYMYQSPDGELRRRIFQLPNSLYRISKADKQSEWYFIVERTRQLKRQKKIKPQTPSFLSPLDLNKPFSSQLSNVDKPAKVKRSYKLPADSTEAEKIIISVENVKELQEKVSHVDTTLQYRDTPPPKYHRKEIELIADFIEGQDLQKIINTNRTVITFSEITAKLIQRIAILHDKEEIVHADLKPTNVIMNSFTREIQLIDTEFAGKKHALSKRGTFANAAPEVFEENPTSFSCDCFALGVSISQLCGVITPWTNRAQVIADCLHTSENIKNELSLLQGRKDLLGITQIKECENKLKKLYGNCLVEANRVPYLQLQGDMQRELLTFFSLTEKTAAANGYLDFFTQVFAIINALTGASVSQSDYDKNPERRITAQQAYDKFIQALTELTEKYTPIRDVTTLFASPRTTCAAQARKEITGEIVSSLAPYVGQ